MSYANVGEWIRGIRSKRSLKQNEAAARSKMAVAQLSRYEAAKKVPSVKTLARFADAMDCSPEEWDEVPLSSAWAEYEKSEWLAIYLGDAENMVRGPIGKWLHSIRTKRGLTKLDVAQKMGVTQATISAYERGAIQPSVKKLLHFASVVHSSPDEWFDLLNKHAGGMP